MSWFIFAVLSAVFAATTAILAKVGVEGVPSTLATAIRTSVILPFTWALAISAGEHRVLTDINRRSLLFLGLSGVATGLSWLAYFRAFQLGPASRVAPIDKLSLPLTIILATVLLHETLSWRLVVGVLLMTLGALLTIR